MANRSKSIPILLAIIVAAAQLLCSCQSVFANWVPAPKPASHACCEKDAGPTQPTKHNCPHCDGTATTAGVIERHQAALPTLDLAFIPGAWPMMLNVGDQLSFRFNLTEPTFPPPASTLLGLHCARNC